MHRPQGGRRRPGAERARRRFDRSRNRSRSLYRWHRRAGLAAALFLLFLAITGMPLQYSGELGLGSRHVTLEPVLDWYRLQAPADARTSAGVVAVGDALYLESGRFVDTVEGFRGAVVSRGLIVAAGAEAVVLIDARSGERVDRFRREDIRGIGKLDGRPVLDTGDGPQLADAALANWAPAAVDSAAVGWSEPQPLTAERAQPYRKQYRHGMLSVERLLQDLHSGRVFGVPGVILVDIASVLLVFLAVSGLIMWWRALPR